MLSAKSGKLIFVEWNMISTFSIITHVNQFRCVPGLSLLGQGKREGWGRKYYVMMHLSSSDPIRSHMKGRALCKIQPTTAIWRRGRQEETHRPVVLPASKGVDEQLFVTSIDREMKRYPHIWLAFYPTRYVIFANIVEIPHVISV